MTVSIDDVLFELSNADRLAILDCLEGSPCNVTQLSDKIGIRLQQVSRHLQRLLTLGLVEKTVSGSYKITNFGWLIIRVLKSVEFVSTNKENIKNYQIQDIPFEYLLTLNVFKNSVFLDNAIDFMRFISENIEKAQKYISLMVDNLPYVSLQTLVDAPSKGIQVQIITEKTGSESEIAFDPIYMVDSDENPQLVYQRTCKDCDMYLYVSDAGCAVSFKRETGFDYRGFRSVESEAISWAKSLFEDYWDEAKCVNNNQIKFLKTARKGIEKQRVQDKRRNYEADKSIIVEGLSDSQVDSEAVQDAVDHYDEVILKGEFNIGVSSVVISNSVIIRGEGREDDIPLTKMYKSGWSYPLLDNWIKSPKNRIFYVDGDGIDVTIENIHFTDFEYNCIGSNRGNSLTIKNNRITLNSAFGRGLCSPVGNQVIGIYQQGGFPGGVIIKGNYLDFAKSFGPFQRDLRNNERADDPHYRPDLKDTYSYIAFGIDIFNSCGDVIIEDNFVRNMNARGVVIADNTESANIHVKNNTIISEIYGAYFGPKSFAGYGIAANSGWHVGPAPHIEIRDNTIRCDKINYCGIGVHGPEIGPIGAQALTMAIVNNNRVHLEDGSIGIYTESCDNSQINGNTLTGKAYYGIGILPGIDENRTEFGSFENVIEDNDMRDLKIKDPDKYSITLFSEKYSHSKAGSTTAFVLLNKNTKANRIKVSSNEHILDEGINNKIIRQ